MCYQFFQDYSDFLADKLNSVVGAGKYFLFSVKDSNYLYIADTDTNEIPFNIENFNELTKTPQKMSEEQLINTIHQIGKTNFTGFYGSNMLYNKFVNDQ